MSIFFKPNSVWISRPDFRSLSNFVQFSKRGSIKTQKSLFRMCHVYPCLHKLCSSWSPLCFSWLIQILSILEGHFMFVFYQDTFPDCPHLSAKALTQCPRHCPNTAWSVRPTSTTHLDSPLTKRVPSSHLLSPGA